MFTTKPNVLGFGEFKVNISLWTYILYLYHLNDFYYLCKGPWIYNPTHRHLSNQIWFTNPYILTCLLKIRFFALQQGHKDFLKKLCHLKKNHNIIYVDVLEAWTSLLIYIAMAISNVLFLLTKHPFFSIIFQN